MANQVLTKSQTPALDFADVTGALAYWVQIAANPRFNTITQQQTALATSTMTPATNLTDATKYFWRFRTRTSAAYTTDQSNAVASAAGTKLRDDAARTGLAQGFKPDRSLPIARVTMQLKRTLNPGSNVWVEIWSDSSGTPSAQLGTDSATVTTASIGTGAFETVTFDFATPVPVVANTQYYVVLQGAFAVSATDYVTWEDSGSANYSDGGPWKHNAAVTFSANGTFDMLFTTQVQGWAAWSDVWSFWVDTTAEVAVTPTASMLVDPDITTDAYTFAIDPRIFVVPSRIRRSSDRNIAGNLLTEHTKTMAQIDLDFGDAFVLNATQGTELIRFHLLEKAIYLITLVWNAQDTVENIYKVEFSEDPDMQQVAPGRYDLKTGVLKFEEAAWT